MGYPARTSDQMRPSDYARERAAQALREHYAEGRLDDRELERRVELAVNAQTRGELKALFRDLPWNPRSRDRREGRWRFQRNLFRAHGVTYLGVNGMLVGIWAATGQGDFWPAESIAGWGAAFGMHWMFVRTLKRSRKQREQSRLGPPRPRRALSQKGSEHGV